jgi:hypothetical protein
MKMKLSAMNAGKKLVKNNKIATGIAMINKV